MIFKNFTPHVVTIVGSDGSVVHEFPSEGVARVSETITPDASVDGVPVNRHRWESVLTGLPAFEPGVGLIVSRPCADASPRGDLFFPSSPVRDSDGRIIGCRALGQVAS